MGIYVAAHLTADKMQSTYAPYAEKGTVMTNEDNLAKAIDQSIAEAQPEPTGNLLKLKPTNDISDFDKLLNAGERLLRLQQDRLSKAEGDYQKHRTEMIERYRASVERLKREAEEHVRLLDQAHVNNVTQIERTITALKGLRGS